MADAYVVAISGSTLTVTKNAVNEPNLVDVNFQVNLRPTQTTTDGEVWASIEKNISLQYVKRDLTSAAAIIAQAGGTGVLGTAGGLSPQSVGVQPPNVMLSSRAGDSITFLGVGPYTSGPGTVVQAPTGYNAVIEFNDALANPRLQ